jgi:hypothetical protein
MLRFTAIGLLVLLCAVVQAQYRTASWVFGDSIIVNFTESGPVLSSEKSAMRAFEAAACISDTNGNLLFYSNNIGVWNRLHQPLQGSEGINSASFDYGSSKTNGTLFLPVSGDSTDSKFWVFITDENDHKLRYSLIDRNLDGGLGGIVSGQKNLLVWDDPISEQLVAIKHGNGRDWWLVSRSGYPISKLFSLARFGGLGLEEVLFSDTLISISSEPAGEMKANLAGDRIGFAVPRVQGSSTLAYLAVLKFDRCSGELLLVDTIGTSLFSNRFYWFEFSSFGTEVFSGTETSGRIFQVRTTGDVLSSELFHDIEGNFGGQLELGPDLNIYFVVKYFVTGVTGELHDSQFLWRISSTGADNYFVDTFKLDMRKWNYTYSLPNFANYELGPLVGSPCDTLSPQDTTQTGIFHPTSPSEGWSVFPTSSSGLFTLQSDQPGWLFIHDLYGREVLRLWHEERTTFDLTAQPAGLYLVHLRDVDGKQSLPQKIIRQ